MSKSTTGERKGGGDNKQTVQTCKNANIDDDNLYGENTRIHQQTHAMLRS